MCVRDTQGGQTYSPNATASCVEHPAGPSVEVANTSTGCDVIRHGRERQGMKRTDMKGRLINVHVDVPRADHLWWQPHFLERSAMSITRLRFVSLVPLLLCASLSWAQDKPAAGGDAVTAPAASQPPARGMMEGSRAWMGERMARAHKRDLEILKKDLKLKPDQMAAWDTYEKTMNLPLEGAGAPSKKNYAKLTSPQRMDTMTQHMESMQKLHAQHASATKTFYGVLTPEQQKMFDAQTRRGPGVMHCDTD